MELCSYIGYLLTIFGAACYVQ